MDILSEEDKVMSTNLVELSFFSSTTVWSFTRQMASNEESSQPAETQRQSIPIGSTSISINLSFVKSLLGIFEGAIIVWITVFFQTTCSVTCIKIIKIFRIFEEIDGFPFFFFILMINRYLFG